MYGTTLAHALRETQTAAEIEAMNVAIEEERSEMTRLRAQLTRQITAAQAAVTDALRTIERLASNEVYDVDFAEGPTDTGDFLTDAARCLRAAAVFNPAT